MPEHTDIQHYLVSLLRTLYSSDLARFVLGLVALLWLIWLADWLIIFVDAKRQTSELMTDLERELS